MIVGLNDRPLRKPPFEIKTACIGPRGGEIHPEVTKESMRTDKEHVIAQGKFCRLQCCTTCTPIDKLRKDVQARNLFHKEGSFGSTSNG